MPKFDVAAAMLSAWELLAAEVPSAWSWRARDVIGLVPGLATPAKNGSWATSAVVNVDAVRAALDSIIDAEFPYCLQFPDSHRGLAALAVELGMEREADVPLIGCSASLLLGTSLGCRCDACRLMN